MKGVFTYKESSIYDDRIAEKYHFPNTYLKQAEALVGDWILYHEPGSDRGRKAYIAVARLSHITPAPQRPKHSYAHVRDFLPLDTTVPIKADGRYYESSANDGTPYFRGRSVRSISDTDFTTIVQRGPYETASLKSHRLLDVDLAELDEDTRGFFEDPQTAYDRPIEHILTNRPIRDAAFRHNVRRAYDDTCAVTGLKIRNGGGRPEVQAAHIWAVNDGGPDTVSNGIALSQTAHWMFDRGLIGIRDDYSLIVSHNKVPEQMRDLFGAREQKINLPKARRDFPDPYYLAKHREMFCL